MRLLLLLFFFVAGTHPYTVFFHNKCPVQILVTRWNDGELGHSFELPLGKNGTDSIAVNEDIFFQATGHALVRFSPAGDSLARTNFSLSYFHPGYAVQITELKPACKKPCLTLRCGVVNSVYTCKKDGDEKFYLRVSGSRRNTMDYHITYCADP